MKYEELTRTTDTNGDASSAINYLKGNKSLDVAKFRSQYEVSDKRPIMDINERPNKTVTNEEGGKSRVEKVNRIPITIQKRIVGSTVSFTFGNPVELTTEEDGEQAQNILKAVKRIQSDAKIDSHNRRVGRELARCTEVAECWFAVEGDVEHERYGFKTKMKIRCQLFSPWNGDQLYPQYDETGDMVGFGRGFTRQEGDKKVEYFEVYTDEERVVWKNDGSTGSGWEEQSRVKNELGKIPVIYGRQDDVEWADVQDIINRLEKLLSNFGDTNDYFGSPILTIEGTIEGLSDKNTSGKVFQLGTGAKAEFLGWDRAPEAIKLEAEMLLRFVYGMTQTPDISFDSVKGLQQISGEALKMLFLDAHLKVQDKREIFDEYLQRRVNLLKAFVGTINKPWTTEAAKIEITPTITPFAIDNAEDLINLLSTATGGKSLLSQQTAVEKSGLVDDPKKEYEQIKKETEDATNRDIYNPVNTLND